MKVKCLLAVLLLSATATAFRPRGEVWNQVCHPQERGGHYGAESARRAVF